MELQDFPIKEIHRGLVNREFSAQELAKAYLEKITKEDKDINAFLTLAENSALSQAKKVDEMIQADREIPLLAGIPLAVKDNILVENIKCTAGSKILENYIAPYNATVVKKLKEIGAIILGKTNMDEFAMGSSTENSGFYSTHNPYDLTRVPGGSSGGSAAAVSANLCCYALGSDTGGSIRQPASFCGVVGLKPTYGAVSRYGLISMASSLDQIGPITKTVEDAKIVFEAIKGKDPLDSTSVESSCEVENSKKQRNLQASEIVVGVPKEYFIKGMDAEVERIIKEIIKKIEALEGVKIEEISLPHTKYSLAAYCLVMSSEASANLARYDGIKFGYSPGQAGNLLDVYLKSREKGLGTEVRRRIMLGTYALSAGFYEAYYLRAQKVRTKILEDFNKAFEIVDIILTPTSPAPAFKIGEKITNPLTMYLSDIFTVSVNLAGLPALSLPCGKAHGLPVGLQIIGKAFEETKILEVGEIFEKLCSLNRNF